MSKGAQMAVGATLIALLLGWFGYTNLEGAATFQYYQTVEELVAELDADGDSLAGRSLRVHGFVALESIDRQVAAQRVRFAIQNEAPHAGGSADGALPVIYRSLETPDLFRDGAEVVVEGRLQEGRVFVADNVLAKCPSKFETKTGADGPSAAEASL